jgi:hypothetical protein
MKILAALLLIGCSGAEARSDVEVVVDANGPSRAISPYVYGINGVDHLGEREGVFTLVRWGGTRATTYNWENNASNSGHDPPGHQNDGYLSPSTEPGAAVIAVLDAARRSRAAVIVTVPMIGHVAADRNADGDVGRTENYRERRFVRSVADGNAADPNDRVVHQEAFVRMVAREAERRRVRVMFALDNEPSVWPAHHPRLREGRPVRYRELTDLGREYGSMIHRAAPRSQVLGPVTFGWPDMRDLLGAPDAQGREFLPYYLSTMRRAGRSRRVLDALDLHWYPDGGDVRVTSPGDGAEVARLRMQMPRSLYDDEYEEPSWIGEELGAVRLIPRMREMIAEHYPRTKLAITEYAYGGAAHPSGAVAQADALGAFGRHGVYAAAYWPLFDQEHDYALAAFRMFRRIDGEISFGDRSIEAESSDRSRVSAWASVDSRVPGRVVIVLVGRVEQATNVNLVLRGASGEARRFVLDRGGPAPREEAAIAPRNGRYRVRIPARSVTTLILG